MNKKKLGKNINNNNLNDCIFGINTQKNTEYMT